MRKWLSFFLSVLLLTQFISCKCISKKFSASAESTLNSQNLWYSYMISKYDNDNLLIERQGRQGELDYKTQSLFLFNLKTNQSERVYKNFDRQMVASFSDINDFVTFTCPFDKFQKIDIGRFQNKKTYTPLIQGSCAVVLCDSKLDNLVFYKYQGTAEDNKLHYMKRDGSDKKSISFGNFSPYNYIRLDQNRGCFYSYIGNDRILGLVNITKQQSITLTEKKKSYDMMGIIGNQMIVRIADNQTGSLTFYLYDFEGNRKSHLFEINNSYDESVYYKLLDLKGKRMFYSYRSSDDVGHIVEYDFTTSKVKEIFSHKMIDSNKSYFAINIEIINQKENFLSFLVKENSKQTWMILHLDTGLVDEIPLPNKTDFELSTDGKYLLLIDIKWDYSTNGIMYYQSKKIKLFEKKLSIDFLHPFYSESTNEFFVTYRYDKEDKKIFAVNPEGKLRTIILE